MIECYFHWCKYHPKDEPFCPEQECKATDKERKEFGRLRLEELAQHSPKRKRKEEE